MWMERPISCAFQEQKPSSWRSTGRTNTITRKLRRRHLWAQIIAFGIIVISAIWYVIVK
jgi:hypothetical protein